MHANSVPDPMQVFCGYEHTFALTSDGDVLGFGNGVKGQLGIGNTGKCNSTIWLSTCTRSCSLPGMDGDPARQVLRYTAVTCKYYYSRSQ